jgi:hypothetical protein
MIELKPQAYGAHGLRRTKVALIYKKPATCAPARDQDRYVAGATEPGAAAEKLLSEALLSDDARNLPTMRASEKQMA